MNGGFLKQKMALRSSKQIPRRLLDDPKRSGRGRSIQVQRIRYIVNSHENNIWKIAQIADVMQWKTEEMVEKDTIDLTNLFSFEVPANPTLLLEEEEDKYPEPQKDFDIGYGPN